MDGLSTGLVLAAVAVAVIDWIAVARDDRGTEYVAKPLTMVLLVAAALALDPADGAARAWFVVALVCSLAGDVFLMLPRDRFVPGLASFLLGHLAYVVGLRHLGTSLGGLVAGVVIVAVALPLLAPKVLGAIRDHEDPGLTVPVTLYMVVISAMVVAAGASGVVLALVAAVAFYASDALIAWTRFVADIPHGRLLVMTTYHLAQIGFVLALV
jgi:alkenylglycerophosphocholine/alkenylglycerophosphoethanolamine hydrolase